MYSRTDCLNFTGSKPCGKNESCDLNCPHYNKRGQQILLIHLGALGAVVRSTALLKAIHQKYPNCQITWVTENPAQLLLKNHPDIHRILTLSEKDLLILSALVFDTAFIIDKSIEATGILKRTKVDQIFGFIADQYGVILPHNQKAEELWQIGLSNNLKFNINKKTEIELITEALGLDYKKDDYHLPLFENEKNLQYQRNFEWSLEKSKVVIGINTGCAPTIQSKKLSIENHRELIRKLQKNTNYQIVLLGGPEDTE